MATPVAPTPILIERFLASVSASNIAQTFVAPSDLNVIGMLLHCGTAPGTGNAVSVNVSNSPTSQIATVAAYNLWTATNVPTLTGAAVTSPGTYQEDTFYGNQTLLGNKPYVQNYPIPGPPGSVGYATAQATSTITSSPVLSAPNVYIFGLNAFVAPDNTYTDYNAVPLTSAGVVHAGDVLTFVVSGGSLGASANLEMVLYCEKR